MSTALQEWVQGHLGGKVSLQQLPGGGSRTSYVVETGTPVRYLLRVDGGAGPLSGTEFTIAREFRVISALHRVRFPVPAIHAHHRELNAMLMEFVDGTTSYQVQVTPEQQRRIQSDLMQHVAHLHTLQPAPLGLTDFARTARLTGTGRAPNTPP